MPTKTKPELNVKAVSNGWAVSFNLHGRFQGINIYRKRPDAKEFSYLATDTSSPYVDTEPMHPGTQYYACYTMDGEETGKESSVLTIEV